MSVQFSSNQIGLHFPDSEKSLQFRQVEESESDNLFHDCIQGEDENAKDVQMASIFEGPYVEALEYHFASMRENYDHNQKTSNQLMQNQMGQMKERFQERQSCVLPSNTDPRTKLHVITSMNGLTLDGSFISHSLVYHEKEQEPKTITKVVEIPSSQSTPLSAIPYPCQLQEENFQALENLTGRADHFVYRIDIVDSLYDKFHTENISLNGNPTPSYDSVVESLSPSLTPSGEIDLLLEETNTFLSIDDSIPPGIDNGIYDSEGDILILEELLNDEILRDLPPSLKMMNLALLREPPDTFLMEDEEIKFNPFKDIDDSVAIQRVSVTPLDSLDSFFDSYDTSYTNPSELYSEYPLNYDNQLFNIQNEHSDEPKTETIIDEVTDIVQKDKNDAKRTKPSTGMERVREIEAKG
ncbi:hypothetical protein Tco_0759873 [Tanacetum coccineum]